MKYHIYKNFVFIITIFFQLLCDFGNNDNNELIDFSNIPLALKKIGIDCNENDLYNVFNTLF